MHLPASADGTENRPFNQVLYISPIDASDPCAPRRPPPRSSQPSTSASTAPLRNRRGARGSGG